MNGLPSDWSTQILTAVDEHKRAGSIVHTILLPWGWKGELIEFVRNRQLNRMFGSQRVGFEEGHDQIEVLSPPGTPPKTEPAILSERVMPPILTGEGTRDVKIAPMKAGKRR